MPTARCNGFSGSRLYSSWVHFCRGRWFRFSNGRPPPRGVNRISQFLGDCRPQVALVCLLDFRNWGVLGWFTPPAIALLAPWRWVSWLIWIPLSRAWQAIWWVGTSLTVTFDSWSMEIIWKLRLIPETASWSTNIGFPVSQFRRDRPYAASSNHSAD